MFGVQAKDGGNGGSAGKGTHDLRVKKEGRKVSIIAREKDGNRRGELFMQLSLNGCPRMRVSYRRKLLANITVGNEDKEGFSTGQDDDSSGGQQVFSYRLSLLNLVETDSQNKISQSSKRLAFVGSTKQWSEWTIVKDTATNLISIFSSFKGSGDFSAVNANLTIEISDLAQIVKGHQFDPNGLKFSFGFDNFPYSNVNNNIAFNMGLWTKFVSNIGDNANLNNTKSLDFKVAKFQWDDTVIADGKVVPVTLKELTKGNNTYVADKDDDDDKTKDESMSLLRFHVGATAPKSVLWDPDMTVAPDQADTLIDNGPTKSAGEHTFSMSMTTIFMSLVMSIFIANMI